MACGPWDSNLMVRRFIGVPAEEEKDIDRSKCLLGTGAPLYCPLRQVK
jgi:hypothetical protein